ncbi:hypothetical protein PRZ48_000568 [Zasmidium cellare]|uniref:Uncharacterized protein n=1 Tax=Zasmidium cellare TaxID=395010 RepID=A0ABR0F0I3_ZASCE|nr:hypothetical protein PRZ48_000568 [Zasmidium cellare]
MPPKKNASKPASKAKKEETNEAPELPATETNEPQKDDTQPAEGDLKAEANEEPSAENVASNGDVKQRPEADSKRSKKRKKEAEPTAPSKASRRSARGATKSEPSKQQLLNFLLSSKAEELVRPEDEKKDVQERGNIRTYSSSVLNPFEELMSAMILSRPISHRLGLRSIRTVLNDPYNFTNAKVVKDAGEEKRHQALWDAKTQHKGKTADQIGMLADVVLDKYASDDDKEDSQLKKVLSDNDNDLDKALSSLKENIKGLGNTGLDIFLRRVQWLWDVGYPYVDGRTRDSLRNIGLTQDAEELQKLVEEHWSKLDTKHLAGEGEAAKKRRAFVVILERVTGADLEGKVDAVLQEAASA